MARRRLLAFLFLLLTALAFVGFMSLGIWQVKRLAWKEGLITRVDARVHAEAVEAPARKTWAEVSEDQHEYLHVQMSGQYRVQAVALVAAATQEGQGYWVMAPLQRTDGSWVYVNQGFVPQSERKAASQGQRHKADKGQRCQQQKQESKKTSTSHGHASSNVGKGEAGRVKNLWELACKRLPNLRGMHRLQSSSHSGNDRNPSPSSPASCSRSGYASPTGNRQG